MKLLNAYCQEYQQVYRANIWNKSNISTFEHKVQNFEQVSNLDEWDI
jgi:hypothetical protein